MRSSTLSHLTAFLAATTATTATAATAVAATAFTVPPTTLQYHPTRPTLTSTPTPPGDLASPYNQTDRTMPIDTTKLPECYAKCFRVMAVGNAAEKNAAGVTNMPLNLACEEMRRPADAGLMLNVALVACVDRGCAGDDGSHEKMAVWFLANCE